MNNTSEIIRCRSCKEAIGYTFGELTETQAEIIQAAALTCFYCTRQEQRLDATEPEPLHRI